MTGKTQKVSRTLAVSGLIMLLLATLG